MQQAETGLNIGFVADLALKFLYFEGYLTGLQVAEMLRLPFSHVVDDVLQFLKRERFVEVKGSNSVREATYQYAITSKGSERAQEVLERSRYVGPAPAPFSRPTTPGLSGRPARGRSSAGTYAALVLSMLLGRLMWGLAMAVLVGSGFGWQAFAAGAFLKAWPGILLHILIIPPILFALKRARLIPLAD